MYCPKCTREVPDDPYHYVIHINDRSMDKRRAESYYTNRGLKRPE